MSVSIRPAQPADIPAITAIHRPAVLTGTASIELDPPVEAEMQKRMQAILASGFPFLVGERQGQVVGYGDLGAYRRRVAYRWSVENSIYVAPAAALSALAADTAANNAQVIAPRIPRNTPPSKNPLCRHTQSQRQSDQYIKRLGAVRVQNYHLPRFQLSGWRQKRLSPLPQHAWPEALMIAPPLVGPSSQTPDFTVLTCVMTRGCRAGDRDASGKLP